ncbi:MAG: cytochrome c oxidase assembly protein, partial [Candidatus Rokuibacteriota bacterium]
EAPPAGRVAAFAAALVAGVAATNGPLHDLAERPVFAAHMAQHLVLILGMAPLLLAATPGWMVDGLLGVILGGPRWRALARALTRPVPALGLYAGALIAWHLPGPFERAVESHAWHLVAHMVLVAGAILAWWPVLSSSRLLPPLPYGAQILYLFAFGIPMTVVAAMIAGAEEVLYPRGAAGLDDQRLGGIIMWVPAGLVPLAAFTIVFFRWAAEEADEGMEEGDFSK